VKVKRSTSSTGPTIRKSIGSTQPKIYPKQILGSKIHPRNHYQKGWNYLPHMHLVSTKYFGEDYYLSRQRRGSFSHSYDRHTPNIFWSNKPLKGFMFDCIHNVIYLHLFAFKNKKIPRKPQTLDYNLPNQIQPVLSFFSFKRYDKRLKWMGDIPWDRCTYSKS
jgi:hypothetical protein